MVIMKINLLLVLLLLAGCAENKSSYEKVGFSQLWEPRLATIPDAPSEGPEEYKQGWRDGCETGMAAYGNMRYKAIYQFKQDQNLTGNPIYYNAWRQSYTYCRYHLLSKLREMEQ